jgi:hypothetical protein
VDRPTDAKKEMLYDGFAMAEMAAPGGRALQDRVLT